MNGPDQTNGKVHNGQKPKRPYKCTEAERDERVALLIRHMQKNPLSTKGELKSWTKSHFRLKYQMAENYINRAEAAIRLYSSHSTAAKRRISELIVGKLTSIAKGGTNSDSIRACRALARIFGIEAPQRHELTGAGGGPIETKDESPLPRLSRERLLQLIQEDQEQQAGEERNGHT
jgi:hypothetical protein